MVLRKDRPLTSTGSTKTTQTIVTMSNEQPLIKRQRIESSLNNQKNGKSTKIKESSSSSSTSAAGSSIEKIAVNDSEDILEIVQTSLSSSLSSSSQSITSTSSQSGSMNGANLLSSSQKYPLRGSSSSVASCTDSSLEVSADEVDKISATSENHSHNILILPDLLPQMTQIKNVALSSSNGSNNLAAAVSKSKSNFSSTKIDDTSSKKSSSSNSNNNNNNNDMAEFEESLIKQCLCGISERTLRKPFQSHYSNDIVNGVKRIANLSEWPTDKLLQFLSNLQLLFDIYLKQNSKGFICSRIMDLCDALIRNDHNLIDEIIILANFNNQYVRFLSGRVLASFLVIAKQQMNENWLRKLVDNLFNFEHLDNSAIQKIHFSLDIIKRIVEWKDIDLHPLEDEILAITNTTADTTNSSDNMMTASSSSSISTTAITTVTTTMQTSTLSLSLPSTSAATLHFQIPQVPSLENNYFAINFREFEIENNSSNNTESSSSSSGSNSNKNSSSSSSSCKNKRQHHCNQLESERRNQRNSNMLQSSTGCNLISLTDSESFDTTHLKCVTIKILEHKWPALVKNMSNLISNYTDIDNAEECILNFLQLWENIISVKANLSIIETLPFYAQLDKLESLLNQSLSCTIYKQMLCLFNEALCYGSTLALQDLLPDETCILAHQIVRHVKDFRILESLPRRQAENNVSFIGFKGTSIVYEYGTLQHYVNDNNQLNVDNVINIEMDKTILQKMVLLVLKSVAVTVKEIRCDSSDSSIDSSDYDAFQDMVLIERSIRDVLKKLESFIKNTLEFHPECHFSKILIHLFDDQDDHLIEAMVCTLDVTVGISFRNNAFPELVAMLNPVYTFLEFLKMIANSSDLLLDLLVSNETCFLLYLLRFLKYIRINWQFFVQSCHDFGMGQNTLDDAMSVLIRLRLQISRLVSRSLYPYDISPVLRLLESCEGLYEGNELS